MGKRFFHRMTASIVLLILLQTTSPATVGQSSIDFTQIGVETGDEFDFILDEYFENSSNNYETPQTEYRIYGQSVPLEIVLEDGDDNTLYISKGEQVKMKIVDAELILHDEDFAELLVEFSHENISVQVEEPLGGLWLSTTDWVGYATFFDELIIEFDEMSEESGADISITTSQTTSEFQVDASFVQNSTLIAEDGIYYSSQQIIKLIYEISTGVMLYISQLGTNTEQTVIDGEINETSRQEFRSIWHRVGYGIDDEVTADFLDFNFSFSLLSIFILWVTRTSWKKRKKYSSL